MNTDPKYCQYEIGVRQLGREVMCGKVAERDHYCTEHAALMYRKPDEPKRPVVMNSWNEIREN